MPPVVVVYWHDVDPRPEQAFAHLSARDNAFFEVRARIDGIKTALEGAGQDQFELRRVGGTDGGDDAHRNDVLAQVRRVHADGYVHWLANVYESAQRPVVADTFPPSVYGARYPRKAPMQMLAGYWCFDSWTPVVKDTYEAALLSAECAIRAARAIGPNTPLTYALCRPPGHHASARRFGGYCYLNNAAIAARVLQQQQDNSGDNAPMRVAILDVDYHHGNGTQDIFYEDPSVFYASLHGDPETGGEPFYVGYDDERGLGAAMGTNLNVPLPYPITDAIYERELAKALDALVAFDPKYLVVSLGVDIYSDDPLSSFGGISIAGFERIGQLIAGKLEHLPTVVVQEGGYNEEMTGACVSSFFKGLTR